MTRDLIGAFELRRLTMQLVSPFRTSFGTQWSRDILLVRALASDAEGWGECVALADPVYSSEFVDAAQSVLARYLAPALLERERTRADDGDAADGVGAAVAFVKGHPMAKAAIEMAVLDLDLRRRGISFATRMGATRDRVPAGVSVGIMDSVGELLDAVGAYLDAGYVRIKLKIEPGWDLDPVRAVRERFGEDVLLQADANTAYTLDDAAHLGQLDAFDLLLIEQPLPEDDLSGHAALARLITTPICLDESITNARAADLALTQGACRVVNIKAGRVGGYLEARRVAEVCVAHGAPAWCGGMLETGLGRAANVALAAGPAFTLPGDVSASGRFWREDITEPFVLDHGHLAVPAGPGLGVDVRPEVLDDVTTSVHLVQA